MSCTHPLLRIASRAAFLGVITSALACYRGVAFTPAADADDETDGSNSSGSSEDGSETSGGSTGEDAIDDCTAHSLAEPRVWRLTATQYERTIARVFGFDAAEVEWAASFPPDPERGYFRNHADALLVPPPLTLEIARAAESITAAVFEDPATHLSGLWTCDVAELELQSPAQECGPPFIRALGLRLYRRPLTDAEVAGFGEMVDGAVDRRRGVELVLETMLQSPHFLYRTELLENPGDVELSAYEAVSFLAFSVWNEGPDLPLLTLAQEGFGPDDHDDLLDRVFSDSRAQGAFSRFVVDWMDVEGTDALYKPDDPRGSLAVADAMAREFRQYVDYVMEEGSGTQAELFSSSETIYSAELEGIYGIHDAADGDIISSPPDERAGLLTLPAWLATYAAPTRPTPIARGIFVRERLLCQPLPPIPPGTEIEVPPPIEGQTERERYARHSEDPTCAGCHTLIDPVGFMFSHYDTLGAFVLEEAGQPVDASGAFSAVSFEGEYDGATDMLRAVAQSPELTACLPRQMYKFVNGQSAVERDRECSLDAMSSGYEEAGSDINALFRALVRARLSATN